MEPTTASVRKLTEACISKFEHLLDIQKPRRIELLESRLADFNLWADGVGALAKPETSLDFRLRTRVNDLEFVKNVLNMLAESLDYDADLAKTDADSEAGIPNLDSAIKNLALIGVAIRQTGRASRHRKAERTLNPDDHQEFRRHLECVVLIRPTEKGLFRQTEDGRCVTELDASLLSDLQTRIIEANLRRRHNFLIAQKRSRIREGRETQFSTPLAPTSAHNLGQLKASGDAQNVAGQDSRPNLTAKGGKRAAPTISGFSLVSTAEGTLRIAPAVNNYTPGAAKTQITLIASDAEFPQPPSIPSGREISKCPCCCQSLPVETFTNSKIWKQHVVEDLSPYTCVAANCPTPQLLFCTRKEWESHVRKSHLPQWQCPFCEEHDADCSTMEAMENHLQSRHEEELLDNSLSTLLSWSAVQRTGIKSCPLCSSHGPEDSPELVDHVLRHVYEFSLRALPWPPPIVHGLNGHPGAFELPPDPEHPRYLNYALVRQWIDQAVQTSEGTPELKLCHHDTADHSDLIPTNPAEYSDYFFTNSYFEDRPEDKSSKQQADQSIASNSMTVSTMPEIYNDLKDGDGSNPLLLAAVSGDEAAVKRRLEAGDEVDLKCTEYGQTPLSRAAESGHEAVVKLLLEARAEVDSKDTKFGQTPLSWAAENGHKAVVKLLLEAGAEVNSRHVRGKIPLSWAAQKGHDAVVKLLLEAGAEVNSKHIGGRIPLSWAVQNGHDAVVKLLLEAGAEVNSKDDNGRTPLSWAAESRHEAVVKLLLEAGAEVNSKDNSGQTPLLWARMRGRAAIIKLLLEAGASDSRTANLIAATGSSQLHTLS